MKIRYITVQRSRNGSTETAAQEFQGDEVFIGRGGRSSILLPGRLISLEHARLFAQDGKIFIEDLNSVSGVRVNGRREGRITLRPKDTITFGDIELETAVDGDTFVIVRAIEAQVSGKKDERIKVQAGKLELSSYLPSIKLLSFLGIGLIGLWFGLMPPLGTNQMSWSSGPISSNHKMVEMRCEACHVKPFEHVQDQACVTCHTLTDHSPHLSEVTAAHPEKEMRCSQCHMEHNGDHGLIAKDTKLCADCHADLRSLDTKTKMLPVASWDTHPEFRVTLADPSGSGDKLRIGLDDEKRLKDPTSIKLNHALHLKPNLRGKDGAVTLQCASCHSLEKNFKEMEKISFDKHCRDCHALNFDSRLPGIEVPHGNDEAIYPAVFTAYTKLLLIDKAPPDRRPTAGRFLPGSATASKPISDTLPPSKDVEGDARKAEEELFTRTGCFLCHNSAAKPVDQQTPTNSHFTVVKPGIPQTWFTKAAFDHGGHEEISCESCHEGVRQSTQTEDLLLPRVKDCQQCHAGSHKAGFVTSDCVTCHSYHDSLATSPEVKRSIRDYLSLVKR